MKMALMNMQDWEISLHTCVLRVGCWPGGTGCDKEDVWAEGGGGGADPSRSTASRDAGRAAAAGGVRGGGG